MPGEKEYVAILTAPGRSAIASVRLVSPHVDSLVNQFFRPWGKLPFVESEFNQIRFGIWTDPDSETETSGEEVVVCRLSDSEFEIHCHGGKMASQRILRGLTSMGVVQRNWQEHLFASEKFLDAEFELALTQARTQRVVKYLLPQRERLAQSFESIVTGLRSQNRDQAKSAHEQIQELLNQADFGLSLLSPKRVVLAGPPNVGKSSLINAIAGFERSIVYDQPGTTRDVVRIELALDGLPVQLSDTAGLRDTDEVLESSGIERAHRELKAADLVVLVRDATQPSVMPSTRLPAAPKKLEVYNKTDLSHEKPKGNGLATSATQKTGIAELIEAIVRKLWPNPPEFDQPIPFTASQIEWLKSLQRGDTVKDYGARDAVLEFKSKPDA